MVRTRNFLIYVLTLVFLVSAIGFTVLSDTTSVRHVATGVEFAPNTATVYGAVATETPKSDRAAYIEAMKAKLARGEGKIDGAPVVFTSVDDIVASATAAYDGERAVLWCDVPERVDHILTSWHERPVTLETLEGARVATQTEVGTSSSRTLLQLPARTTRAAYDSCLAHEIVGVGTDGGLITNDQVWRFYGSNADTLLGYALDGFPIYGFAADETQLDQCGGMETPLGYAYFLRGEEEFVLGCFAGTPAAFLE